MLRRGVWIALISLGLFGALVLPVWPQSNDAAPPAKDQKVISRRYEDQQFKKRLLELAEQSRSDGLSKESVRTLADIIERDPTRSYLFLADERQDRAESTGEFDAKWQQRWLALRSEYAQQLFDLAVQAHANDQADDAYQWLHEVLFWDPQHEAARTVLGHRRVDGVWQAHIERLRVREAPKAHPILKWPAKSYRLVTTENFEIYSQADEATTIRLAESLQRWHEVWRQLYFEYWSSAAQLGGWIDGTQRARSSSKKYRVTFFANRERYVADLEPIVPGVGISSGYYDDRLKMAFYYDSEEASIGETWCHEMVHQLFQEAPGTKERPFEKGFLWLCEGLAMHMESLRDFGDFVTVGGWDATRLQYARLRRIRDGKFLPSAELSQMSLAAFQQAPDIKELYSQAAGMVHFLMNPETKPVRQALVRSLRPLYAGRLRFEQFEKTLGLTAEDFDRSYHEWLRPTASSIENFMIQPRQLLGLSLPQVVFRETTMAALGECSELEWLDLTEAVIEGGQLSYLQSCRRLETLYLTRCHLTTEMLKPLASLPALRELDLSGSNVTDEQLATLETMKQLEVLSVAGTKITAAGVQKLQSSLPNLRISQ